VKQVHPTRPTASKCPIGQIKVNPANSSLSASFARSIVIAVSVPATSDAWLFSSLVPVISTLLTHYHFAITAILAKNDLASSTPLLVCAMDLAGKREQRMIRCAAPDKGHSEGQPVAAKACGHCDSRQIQQVHKVSVVPRVTVAKRTRTAQSIPPSTR
jgi:hypothetical protein